jgi:lysine-specific demethylase/histidyl-hydroxylase NO66
MTDQPPGALARCVGDPGRFLADDWGRRPLHHAGDGGYQDLLSFADVDRMLSAMALRVPAFRLIKDGATLPSSLYARSGRTGSRPITGVADPARIFELFRQGATLVLQGMHRFWEPLAAFCRDLDVTLGHPTQVNGYITPPGSRGLAVHRDAHDVFVLQSFGRKHWEVWEPGMAVDAAEAAAPLLSVELQPGESLYIPEDTPHAARTQETVSGHLTVGILTTRWTQVLREVLKRAESDGAFAGRLPVGYHRDPEGFAAAVTQTVDELARWFDKLDPSDVARARIRSFLTTRPSLVTGTLEGLLDLDAITDETRVRRRRLSVCELQPDGDRLAVLLGDRELRMPAHLEPAMRDLAAREQFRPSDLDLDPESRVVLVRRLVREGLLEVDE